MALLEIHNTDDTHIIVSPLESYEITIEGIGITLYLSCAYNSFTYHIAGDGEPPETSIVKKQLTYFLDRVFSDNKKLSIDEYENQGYIMIGIKEYEQSQKFYGSRIEE